MKPKILIDSISLLSALTGIGRYTYEVSERLEDLNNFEIYYFYGFYSSKLKSPSDVYLTTSLKSLLTKNQFLKKFSRKILIAISRVYRPKFDIYWQPNFIPNGNINAKKVVTSVHDFSFILYKEFHPKERIEHFEQCFFKNILRSDLIITGSNFSKQEILDRIDIDESRVKVVYHGVRDDIFKPIDNVTTNLNIPKKFILSVGSIEPRKNLISLLKAYNSMDVDIKNEYKLVLIGFKGWENREIISLINESRDNIFYLGFVSDIELATIYNLATCFVFPSLYEGFGLPVLEAMACGTPVIASNSSSIPEVGGDAVIYCNPYSILDIKDKIESLLINQNLQIELREKGLLRAREFNWKKSAKEHMDIFLNLLR